MKKQLEDVLIKVKSQKTVHFDVIEDDKDFYNDKPDLSEQPSFCSEDERSDKIPSMARVSSDSVSQPVDLSTKLSDETLTENSIT